MNVCRNGRVARVVLTTLLLLGSLIVHVPAGAADPFPFAPVKKWAVTNWYMHSKTEHFYEKRWFNDPESALFTDWVWYGQATGGSEAPCEMQAGPAYLLAEYTVASWNYSRDSFADVFYFHTPCDTRASRGPYKYGSGVVRYWKCPAGQWNSPKVDSSQEVCYRSADVYDPELNKGRPPCADSCFGDPVNAGTGNKFERRIEFSAPNSPLEFSWTYNSDGASIASSPVGDILGVGRTTNFSPSLTLSASDSIQSVYINRPTGGSVRFEPSGSGWISVDTPGVRLTRDDEGAWSFRDADNSLELFDSTGVLRSIVDPDGRAILFNYGPANRLESALDERGRQLRFEYDATNRLQRVLFPDGGFMSVKFDSKERLTLVTYQDGSQRQYRYDEPAFSAATTKGDLLTTELDEQGQVISETYYDADGRAYLTREGGITTESAVFTSAEHPLYSRNTTVSRASGATSQIEFGIRSGQVVPLRVATGCASCESQVTHYAYGAFGLPTQISRNGIVEERDYDSIGRIVSVIEAQGRPEERTTQIEWHPTFNRPVTRRTIDATSQLQSLTSWTYDDAGRQTSMTTVGTGALLRVPDVAR